MSEPYLILHKVHGEPAFDIAARYDTIPEGEDRYNSDGTVKLSNAALDMIDEELDPPPWWIIPTSGHRAYPARYWPLHDVASGAASEYLIPMIIKPFLPIDFDIDVPDHYAASASRSRLATAASDILSLMGIGKAKPQAPVKRRVIP